MNKKVKRYFVEGPDWELIEDDIGELVEYEAYSALLAERDALKEDAERYRRIRQQGLPDAAILEMDSYYDTVTFAKGCRLDAAVDNAMQQPNVAEKN